MGIKTNRIYDLDNEGGSTVLHMTSTDIAAGGLNIFLSTDGSKRVAIDPSGNLYIRGFARDADDEKLGE